ncbi:aldose 1-epimerase isoform X2 [Cephus cinctus]|nr:aldose 1-epimerase isoform X2 [Cephus cinctus]XP_015586420.1 aldose 1-epimerase isoform X2 [Cephus cinctus]
MYKDCGTVITVEPWGSVDGKEVDKYTLKNTKGVEIEVISYGATIVSVKVPGKTGTLEDVVLGFDNIEGYTSSNNPYFGATIGRVANRIGKARFSVDGVEYNLAKTNGENTLHGGVKGWNAYVWNAKIDGESLTMTLLSKDGDEGFPGTVNASLTITLNDEGKLRITMSAVTNKATPINLTNHSYFNLAGHGSNATELYNHIFELNADRWTVTDSESIPTGEIRAVENSIMDLRKPTRLADVINNVPGGGYDYNFCLPENNGSLEERFVAKVVHPSSGRYLEVYSDQPGVQLYTSNFLPKENGSGIMGKQGKKYYRHGAFCLETQNYPDAVNHDNFPNSILRPGDTYHHVVTYKFGVQA